MALKYQRATGEDLELGHGDSTVTNPAGGTLTGSKIGIHTLLGEASLSASDFAGVNESSRLSNAFASVPSTGGVVYSMSGTQTISSDVFTAITKKITVVFRAGTHTLSESVTIPATMTLVVERGAILSIAASKTLTISGEIQAGYYQIFSGTGTVSFGTSIPRVVDPIWWGAAYDGATDDQPEIQAAIDSLGNTTPTMRACGTVWISGPAAIGDTVTIDHKALRLTGGGTGSLSATTPKSGGLIWIGAAYKPMVRVHRCRNGVNISDLRFFGNTTNVPRSAVSFTSVTGFASSSHIVERCYIGALGSDTGYSDLACFNNGVVIGDNYYGTATGESAGNDFIVLDQVIIQGIATYSATAGQEAGVAIRQSSIQNLGTIARNCLVYSAPIAVQACSSFYNEGSYFSASVITDYYVPLRDDYEATVVADIMATDHKSENSRRFMYFKGHANVNMTGGYFQHLASGSSTYDEIIIAVGTDGVMTNGANLAADIGNDVTQRVRLNGTRFTGSYAGAWTIDLRAVPTTGAVNKHLIMDGVMFTGSTVVPTYQLTSVGATDSHYLYVRYGHAGAGNIFPVRTIQNMVIGQGVTHDLTRYDVLNDTLQVGDTAARSGAWRINSKSATLTMSGATVTSTGLIPANSIVFGVTARVTLAITGATTWSLGNASYPNKWSGGSDGNSTLAINLATTCNVTNWNRAGGFGSGGPMPSIPYITYAAEDIVATANGSNFTAGTVIVTVYYFTFAAPVLN